MLLLPVNPILMHSMSLLLLLLPLPAILMLSIGCQFIISGPTSLSVCHAILSGRDHSGGDHEYILYTLYMIHMVTKDRSARRVPASDSWIGGLKEHTFPTALCVDLCGEATWQVETT